VRNIRMIRLCGRFFPRRGAPSCRPRARGGKEEG
jgi:hypothetical protein